MGGSIGLDLSGSRGRSYLLLVKQGERLQFMCAVKEKIVKWFEMQVGGEDGKMFIDQFMEWRDHKNKPAVVVWELGMVRIEIRRPGFHDLDLETVEGRKEAYERLNKKK